MKVATYNIFEGAKNSLPQLEEFVRQQALDVLCLQEANGWLDDNSSQLEKFAKSTGFAHVATGGNRAFKLATFSRSPFLASTVHSDGFWHGAVETIIDTPVGALNIWNTHLKPSDEDGRLTEVAYIIGHSNKSELTLVVGDFNSLSEADEYPDELARKLAARGIKKFGIDRNRYEVTWAMLNGGFLDIADTLGVNTNTVPTPANTDKYHADTLRLDYMFATASLMKYVTDFIIPKNELTDRISDHYPQVATIQL